MIAPSAYGPGQAPGRGVREDPVSQPTMYEKTSEPLREVCPVSDRVSAQEGLASGPAARATEDSAGPSGSGECSPGPQPAAAPTAATGSRQPTILVVEDVEAVRTVMRQLLQRAGYRVLETQSAEEALALLATLSEPPDLLLTDVLMPRMNGLQLLQRLRTDYPRLKALFVSGDPGEEAAVRGLRDEQAWFLPKPFTPDQFIRKVREVLDR